MNLAGARKISFPHRTVTLGLPPPTASEPRSPALYSRRAALPSRPTPRLLVPARPTRLNDSDVTYSRRRSARRPNSHSLCVGPAPRAVPHSGGVIASTAGYFLVPRHRSARRPNSHSLCVGPAPRVVPPSGGVIAPTAGYFFGAPASLRSPDPLPSLCVGPAPRVVPRPWPCSCDRLSFC